MAFAKLSGSLLACRQAPPAPAPGPAPKQDAGSYANALSALQGGEGGDPLRSSGEGEVSAGKRSGIPPLTPPPPPAGAEKGHRTAQRRGESSDETLLGPAPAAAEARLLAHCLKALKLPTFLDEHDRLARQCAAEGLDHSRYLLRLARLELAERERRRVARLIEKARFPAVKSLDSFDFAAIPALDAGRVRELARGDYIARRENVVILGNSGTGKTHIALGLGLAACRSGLPVGFVNAASLVHELLAEPRVLRVQRRLDACKLLIIDELGYVPLSAAGAGRLFEVFSRRCERAATIITSNLPIEEWLSLFGTERLTGALLDRLTYRAHILEMNGESYRLRHRQGAPGAPSR